MSQYEPLYDSFSHGGHGGYVPTPRMSVSASVYLPGSDVDPQTGWLKPDRQRRCRTQGKKLEMERLTREQQALEESIRREMSKGGVRISVRMGVFLTALLLFICGLCVLLQQGTIADRQKDINRLERSIADCRSQNAALPDLPVSVGREGRAPQRLAAVAQPLGEQRLLKTHVDAPERAGDEVPRVVFQNCADARGRIALFLPCEVGRV